MSLLTIGQALQLRAGKRLVFTNGVFDLIHAGHVAYLRQAAQMGDLLLVGINSDASARRLGKGADRPIMCLEDRAAVLSELRCVAGVVAFEEDNPSAIIRLIKPEVHVKGGDYKPDDLPESPVVREYGGHVAIIELLPGRSTSELIRRIRGS